jgi:C-terminal processing protease CtpA/Prc
MGRRLVFRCLAAALLSLSAWPAAAQQLDALNRSRVETMLAITREAIASHYYDSTFHGIDLAATYDTAAARLRAATDFDRALAAVAQFVLDLHDSHTFFVPPQRTVWAEYGWDMAMIGDTCFVVSVDRGSDAEKQGVQPGDAVLSLSGYAPTRDNLMQLLYLYRLLRPQRALRTTLRAPGEEPRTLDLAATIHERKHIIDLTGADDGQDIARLIRDAEKAEADMRSEVVEVGDSTLVWRLPTFGVSTRDVGDAVDRARRKHTLILDLRGNSGGPVRVLYSLLGRLSRDPVTIGIEHERKGRSPLVAEGAGDDAFGGQLIVLVDSRSASASEVTARVVQLAGRGRVIGDRTAGAVMRARYHGHSIGTQTVLFYGVNVTDADLEMSDGGRLEGVGVAPDEVVLPTAADLAAGRDPVLARAVTLAGKPISADDAGGLLARRRH